MRNISIRLTPEEFARMSELADRYQVTQAQVIRWAISALNSYTEKTNGTVTLPLDLSRTTTHQLNEPEHHFNGDPEPSPESDS